MTIRRERGRFRAILKSGRTYVGGRTFDTRREAQAWLNREQASLAGGVDPRAGKAQVRTLLPVWLEERKHTVAAKTFAADAALTRLLPTFLGALSVGAVTDREVTRALVSLSRSGLAISSVHRFRDSLSSFFAWAVRERVARQLHGTGFSGFLPASWDHLICQSWDHPACCAGLSWVCSLTSRVMTNDAEVNGDGFQGGQCGRGA